MSLAAYRQVLRSARLAFQGDLPVLAAAKQQAREQFRQNAALPAGSPEAAAAVSHAQDVAKILRENIVQGKLEGENHYKLRIHEHTERGDNESIKDPDTAWAGGKGVKKCCSA